MGLELLGDGAGEFLHLFWLGWVGETGEGGLEIVVEYVYGCVHVY